MSLGWTAPSSLSSSPLSPFLFYCPFLFVFLPFSTHLSPTYSSLSFVTILLLINNNGKEILPHLHKHQILAEVQDMLPTKMALWHIQCVKLRSFRKIAEAGRSLWPLPSLETGHKTLTWEVPSFLRKSILIWENKEMPRKILTNRLCSPYIPHISHIPPSLSTLHQT